MRIVVERTHEDCGGCFTNPHEDLYIYGSIYFIPTYRSIYREIKIKYVIDLELRFTWWQEGNELSKIMEARLGLIRRLLWSSCMCK